MEQINPTQPYSSNPPSDVLSVSARSGSLEGASLSDVGLAKSVLNAVTRPLSEKVACRVVSTPEYKELQNQNPQAQEDAYGRFYRFLIVSEPTRSTILIANTTEPMAESIERDDAWKRRLEIIEHLDFFSKELSFDFSKLDPADKSSLVLAILTDSYRAAFDFKIEASQVLETFFKNSQHLFERRVRDELNGSVHYDQERYATFGVRDPGYSHIAHFGHLYAEQIKALQGILKDKQGNVTVVDLGCGGANFMLTAAKLLTPIELARTRFVGIDLGSTDSTIGSRMLMDIPGVRAEILLGNVADRGFVNLLTALEPDLIIANHILEHVKGNPENFLQHWSFATKNLLSVAVPLGDEIGISASSHRHVFNVAALERISRRLVERMSHTIRSVGLDQTKNSGMLVFEKDQEVLSRGGFQGPLISLSPKSHTPVPSDLYEDFTKPFDPSLFARAIRSPKIATLEKPEEFMRAGLPRQVRQLPIMMPGSPIQLPIEFEQLREAVQVIIDHNAAINPRFKESYAYLNLFRGMTEHDSYRGLSLSCHGDQLQTLDERFWFPPDYSYIGSSTLPTMLYDQGFDVSEAMQRFKQGDRSVDLYDYFNAQADTNKMYRTENFGIYLLSPYIVHSAAPAETNEYRVFIKVAISTKRFYDNREERRNPAFDYADWYKQPTVGRLDGWLQHGHYNERFLSEDLAPRSRSMD